MVFLSWEENNYMAVRLTFLGGVGTVTGSKYLIESGSSKTLIDCGLFQGFKQLRLRNWDPLPVDPGSINAVVLTHAHLDHSGYVPLLVRNGFTGDVVCTDATKDLCGILLPDSGFLAERDAEYANKRGFSKHKTALPLYTQRDAKQSLERFRAVSFGEAYKPTPELTITFIRAGHILGAAMVKADIDGKSILFTGDLGRPNDPIMSPPGVIRRAEYLIVESTYGDRLHDKDKAESALEEVINATARRGGTVLIPAFAVGRAQALLYYLERLKNAERIPNLPIFLDSPMAVDASELFCKHVQDHRLSPAACRSACGVATYVRDAGESKALGRNHVPKVIVSASGMATGGRVLHHLKYIAPDQRNSIIFSGFQAPGTRGAKMVDGADTIKIHGEYVKVRAEVHNLSMLSAHADANEIMAWLGNFQSPPEKTFITHGGPAASDALRHRIEEELGWPCSVPEYRDTIELS